MKKVLVIKIGTRGVSDALADAYFEGAKSKGNSVKVINLSNLKFDPILHVGKVKDSLEKDLVESQKLILWAEHIFLSYPNWWATMPALLKGFFDKVLTPKFAFEYRKNFPVGLLKGKTASVVCVTAGPGFYNFFVGIPGLKAIKKNIFGFCGIKTKTRHINSYKDYEKDEVKYNNLKKSFFNYGTKLN
ncbi:NAD(P)H-dependent oxidoreductase [archaeon]|nr:NAD(P)H-dependent oxidoreductase [archaeon]